MARSAALIGCWWGGVAVVQRQADAGRGVQHAALADGERMGLSSLARLRHQRGHVLRRRVEQRAPPP
ncbi:hypothetical protein [Ramlibacter sp. H39-3-26]|uniref:hypothetical protein n=1 Tax=Curvibacter soli TaxID=3031331 RepID=UPI0023DCA896|nr:hypothetical protein [Ramlibacter sp. H39-3-26]